MLRDPEKVEAFTCKVDNIILASVYCLAFNFKTKSLKKGVIAWFTLFYLVCLILIRFINPQSHHYAGNNSWSSWNDRCHVKTLSRTEEAHKRQWLDTHLIRYVITSAQSQSAQITKGANQNSCYLCQTRENHTIGAKSEKTTMQRVPSGEHYSATSAERGWTA